MPAKRNPARPSADVPGMYCPKKRPSAPEGSSIIGGILAWSTTEDAITMPVTMMLNASRFVARSSSRSAPSNSLTRSVTWRLPSSSLRENVRRSRGSRRKAWPMYQSSCARSCPMRPGESLSAASFSA